MSAAPQAASPVSPPVRRGEFIELHPLLPEHAALTFGWRQSQRAQLLNEGAATVAQQAAWIAARPAGEHNFLIVLKQGTAVGMLSLCALDLRHRHAEAGRFLIGDEAAARGIPVAAEAMKMLYQLAFDELDLRRVHGTVASDNTLMIKWQKFMGMQEEGRLRRHYFIDGHYQDAVLMGILEDEFRRVALPRLNAMIAAGRSRPAAQANGPRSCR